MDVFDGTTIFWLIAIGLLTGAITKLSIGNKGLTFITNLIIGVFGSLIVGGITITLQLPGGLLFALLSSLAILFIFNVFKLQPDQYH